MRRNILLIATVLLASIGWSQTMYIHYKNGQTVQYNMNNIDYVEYTENNPNNTQISSGDAIDLGLSVLWASCNVGATSPEQYGDKISWGEINPKNKYNKGTYIYYDKETESFVDIGLDIKGTEYDAAYVKWGNNWRMPTNEETRELKTKCSWEWSRINGVNGYKVTGNNGNSIFIPYANESTILWSSIIEGKNGTHMYAYTLMFNDGGSFFYSYMRYCGGFVRPVMPK